MAQLTLFAQGDNEPKSIIDRTCKKWGFEVRKIEHGDDYLYAINDWLGGIVANNAKQTWTNIQKGYKNSLPFLVVSSKIDGKGQPITFTDKNGIFLITQSLRPSDDRPIVIEVQQYLANSGEFVDLLAQSPIEASQYLNDKIGVQVGEDEKWAQKRVKGMVARDVLTVAIKNYISDPKLAYGYLTGEEYKGLFHRTASQLTKQNGGLKPRDGMHGLALDALTMAEYALASKLEQRQEVTTDEAIVICRDICKMIEPMVTQLTNYLGIDIATNKKLLNG